LSNIDIYSRVLSLLLVTFEVLLHVICNVYMIQPFKFFMTSILMATIVSGWLVLLAQWMFLFRNEVSLESAFRIFYILGGGLVVYSVLLICIELISQRFEWSVMSYKMLGITFVGGLVWSIWFGFLILLQIDTYGEMSSRFIGALSGLMFLGVHFFTMYWWSVVVQEGLYIEEKMQGLLPVSLRDLGRSISIALLPVLMIIGLWMLAIVTDTYPVHWLLDWRVVLIVLIVSMIRVSQFLYRVSSRLRFVLIGVMIFLILGMGWIGIESFRWSQVSLNHFRIHGICQEGVVYLSEPRFGEISLFINTSIPYYVKSAPFDDYARVKEVLGCKTVGEAVQRFSIEEVSDEPTENISVEVPDNWVRFRSVKYRFSFAYPSDIEVSGDPELEEIPSVHTYFQDDEISFSRVRLERDLDIQTYLRERKKLRCDYLRSNIAWSLVDRLQLFVQSCPEAVSENLAYRTVETEGVIGYVESGVYSTSIIVEIRPEDSRPGGFLVLELLRYNENDLFVKQFLSGIKFD
jgi:hypothetical protein